MSTDPSTPSPGQPPSTAETSPARAPEPASGPLPVRTGSGAIARLLTVVYALIVTPVAASLVVYGATPWQQHLLMRLGALDELLSYLFSPNGLPTLLALVGGLLLLASVVATGLASSAGLLSVSLLTLFPLSQLVWPRLPVLLHERLPEFLYQAAFGLLSQGVTLLLFPVMGGLGLALVIARRRPRPSLALSLAGVALVPLVMLAATLMAMNGLAVASISYARTFGMEGTPPLATITAVIGVVLLWLACAATGASPYAQILPALVTLAATAVLFIPGLLLMLPSVFYGQIGGTWMSVLVLGGGAALGLVLLLHTAVQFAVSARARRRVQTASAP